MIVNKEKLEYHWKYFRDYYGDDFKNGQGTEYILDALNHFSVPGSWLDLGGGSNSYFWLTAMNGISDITVIDKDIEASIILEKIRCMQFSEGCYNYAMEKYHVSPRKIYSTPLHYIVGDLFSASLHEFVTKKYDVITQIGLWGLLRSKTDYLNKLRETCECLAPNGILLSANWVFEEPLITQRGFTNKYLSKSFISDCAEKCHKTICYIDEVPIYNDPLYSRVFIFVIKEN